MQLAARTGAWHGEKLPYDSEVEWLESTGTQWLNVGYEASDESGFLIDFSYLPEVRQDGYVFGCRNSQSRCSLNVTSAISELGTAFYYGFGGMSQIATYPSRYDVLQGKRFLAKLNWKMSRVCECENSVVNCGEIASRVPSIYLFCENRNGEVAAIIKGKIFSFAITEKLAVAMSIIPVRFTNENGVSEGAMYDKVSGQLFRNAGTGAFVIGPDVVSSRGGVLNA